ncbi:MAG: CorA family divalent cation transporter [Amaricoccus sp.]
MKQTSDIAAAHASAPGFLWAFAGSATGETLRIPAEEIAAARAEHRWLWVHVDLLDQRARGWVQSFCSLPSDVTSQLLAGQEVGLAFERDGAQIRGVCPDYSLDFLRLSDSIGQFGFVVGERLLVTGWRHPLAGIDAVRTAASQGARFTSGFAVLAGIIAGFSRAAIVRLRQAEKDLDRVEDRLLAARALDERVALKQVRRLALALHRPVAAMLLLLGEEVEEAEEAEEADRVPPAGSAAIGDMAARLAALDQAVRSVSDRAKLLQEEIAAELADESNRSLSALTVMTALLMPGTLVAGVFGMNTGGLPFENPHWGTVAALVLAIVSTVAFYRILIRAGASLKF